MSLKSKLLNLILGKDQKEEMTMLHKWKDDTQANLDSLKDIAKNQDWMDSLKDYKDVDQDAAWSRIDKAVSPGKVLSIGRVSKIAAAIVLMLGAIWGFSLLTQKGADTNTPMAVYHSDQQAKVYYRDGSVIDMDQKSDLKELAYREFDLSGRAFFSVAKDLGNKFVVHTVHGNVEVLGTEFNISTNHIETTVFVRSGKVRVSHEGNEYILNPNDYIVLQNGSAVKTEQPLVQPDIWKNSTLRFENQSLHHVMEAVSLYYNLKLEWDQKLQKEDACKINTVFQSPNIEAIMKEMKVLVQIQYEIKSNKLIIHDYKC